MTDLLATVIIVVCLLLAAWCLVATFRDSPMQWSHLIGLVIVEVLLLVQAGVAIAKMIGGAQAAEPVTFVAYLVGAALVPPASYYWGRIERTRWGPAVIAVAALVLAVLVVRLQQTWANVH